MKGVIYRPEAAADVEEACAWYETQRVGLAAEFLASLPAAEDAVQTTPLAYQLHRRDTRRCRLRRFPYQRFYRVLGEQLVIVACFHVIADPDDEEHAAMLEWAGGAFDPTRFSPAQVRFDDLRARWRLAFGRG